MGTLWRLTEEHPGSPPGRDADLARLVEETLDPDVARQVEALVRRVDELEPEDRERFAGSIDEGQVRSKLWLIRELTQRVDLEGTYVVVLGAWFGILPLLVNLTRRRPPARMICVDIDATAVNLGRRAIGSLYSNIEYAVADAMDLDYGVLANDQSSVLVNTICEHLSDAPEWWARVHPGQLAVLQSNNYDRCRDHVNCVSGVEEMKAQTPMTEVLFEGALRLPIFDRFMLIGHR